MHSIQYKDIIYICKIYENINIAKTKGRTDRPSQRQALFTRSQCLVEHIVRTIISKCLPFADVIFACDMQDGSIIVIVIITAIAVLLLTPLSPLRPPCTILTVEHRVCKTLKVFMMSIKIINDLYASLNCRHREVAMVVGAICTLYRIKYENP